MRNIKFLSVLLAIVGVITLASCKNEWAPGAPDSNMGVYFPNTSNVELSEDGVEAKIVVKRNKTDEAATIKVRATDNTECGLFTIQNTEFVENAAAVTISFEAGSDETEIVFGYDGSQLEIGKRYTFDIQLDQESASMYGISSATFTLAIPEPWVKWDDKGTKGIYFDEFLCYVFEEADEFLGAGTYVEFQKHGLDENRIRVVDPFCTNNLIYMWGGAPNWMIIEEGDEPFAIEFDITDPNNVKLSSNPVVLNLLVSQYRLGMAVNVDKDGNYVAPIVLENGIIKFPQNEVALLAYDAASGELLGSFEGNANKNGYMQFYLPGTEFVNYQIFAQYGGMYVSPDGATAEATFNFALGADVASYKFAFVPGNVTADPAETAAAIVAGSEELTIFESDAATKEWQVELTKGQWTLVAVPYTAEGEARLQDTYALYFYFNGAAEMPEVELNVQVGTPASFVAEEEQAAYEAETPACYWIGINVVANYADFMSMRAWWGTAEDYKEQIEENGMTDSTLIAKQGVDLAEAPDFYTTLEENGAAMLRLNVDNGYEYKVLFVAETIYGTTIAKSFDYTMPAYDGGLTLGEYSFTQTYIDNEEKEKEWKFNFTLRPGKSYSDFYFVHDEIDGSVWYVKYDEAAGTITNSGVELDYEDYGSQWGMIYGALNAQFTQVYSYYSATTAEYTEQAPMVMTVENNAIAALQTYFAMVAFAYDPATDTLGEKLGYVFQFSPETVIAPVKEAVEEDKDEAEDDDAVATYAVKAAKSSPCEVHSVVASESKLVIKATPVAPNFTMANLTLK